MEAGAIDEFGDEGLEAMAVVPEVEEAGEIPVGVAPKPCCGQAGEAEELVEEMQKAVRPKSPRTGGYGVVAPKKKIF